MVITSLLSASSRSSPTLLNTDIDKFNSMTSCPIYLSSPFLGRYLSLRHLRSSSMDSWTLLNLQYCLRLHQNHPHKAMPIIIFKYAKIMVVSINSSFHIIPRLELTAAVLFSRLISYVQRVLELTEIFSCERIYRYRSSGSTSLPLERLRLQSRQLKNAYLKDINGLSPARKSRLCIS